MAQKKFDGVIEAVHYTPEGSLAWVRAYERRGPTFSDLVLIDRAELIKHMKAGKKYVLGHRILYRASDFEVSQALSLAQKDGHEFLILENAPQDGKDNLKGAPVV